MLAGYLCGVELAEQLGRERHMAMVTIVFVASQLLNVHVATNCAVTWYNRMSDTLFIHRM